MILNRPNSQYESLSQAVVIASPMTRDREYLRHIVEQCGMRPIEATTYRDALTAVGNCGAVAILCDESLPWRDIVGHLAEGCDAPRVIVIAAEVGARLFAEVLNVGGFDVLTKPFSEADVARVHSSAASRSDPASRVRRPAGSERRMPVVPESKRA